MPRGVAARGPPVGVLRSAAHRRVEFRLPVWLRGIFIIAVHHAFVLGLGARHTWYCEAVSGVHEPNECLVLNSGPLAL